MPDAQPNPTPTTGSASAEWIVLDLMLDADQHRVWSTQELAREIGRPVDVTDAIDALHGAGLIHRTTDGFVFVTRAAAHFSQITL